MRIASVFLSRSHHLHTTGSSTINFNSNRKTMSAWNRFRICQMQLNGSLDFLQKKLCSVKSTRSLSSLVAAAESRLQELNQLSAEIMDTGSPEQTRFVTATATDIAVRLLQLQSDINDNDSLTQYNAQLIHDFERRNTKSDNAQADIAQSSVTDNHRAETSYSLPDDRRAETSQHLQLYDPNCGYNNLHHRPRHSQPNMSSAIFRKQRKSDKQTRCCHRDKNFRQQPSSPVVCKQKRFFSMPAIQTNECQ